jgi:dTDP-glucose 4,6-dehydratase
MKLLVTGGLGFIGSNFILDALKNTNYEIVNVDAEFYGSNHYNLIEIEKSKKYSFVKGDITNKKLMENLISECDCIVNFAAESHVDRSILDPSPFLNSNILGTFTILDIIKNQKKRLIHVSTDEVYGTILKGSATENTRFNPSSPYAATKAASELLINSYFTTYDVDVVITRCTNNYGPRQFNEKLIPKTIGFCNENKKIPVYGTGASIRDWIHVEDHCKAIMLVLEKGKGGESYNISSSNEVNNLTLVTKILEILNKSKENIQFVEDRPGEDTRYSLDSTKIRNELGWKPKIIFEEGLEETIQWYQSNQEWWNQNNQKLISNPWEK